MTNKQAEEMLVSEKENKEKYLVHEYDHKSRIVSWRETLDKAETEKWIAEFSEEMEEEGLEARKLQHAESIVIEAKDTTENWSLVVLTVKDEMHKSDQEFKEHSKKTVEEIMREIHALAGEVKRRNFTGQGNFEKASSIYYMTEEYVVD